MAVLLPRSIFFHVPKTGGMWVRSALRNAGLPACEIANDLYRFSETWELRHSICHADTRTIHSHGRLTFAFVRNPLSWYQSQWSYQMRTGWAGKEPLATDCRAENFQDFVRRCIKQLPGFLSQHYALYDVDFVGKYERLEEDLVRALRMAGEDFDEHMLRTTPPENLGSQSADMNGKCEYTPELRAQLLASEREAVEKYGYG
ncbi:MAG TPA: hypothetical protein VJB10_02760 [Candidatus Peribacteraceae bacterium]|nr:hypothetical protein [Candidatus Peribacteraceae bacterium]